MIIQTCKPRSPKKIHTKAPSHVSNQSHKVVYRLNKKTEAFAQNFPSQVTICKKYLFYTLYNSICRLRGLIENPLTIFYQETRSIVADLAHTTLNFC